MKKAVLHVVTFVIIIGLSCFGASKLFPEERILARIGNLAITQTDVDEMIKLKRGNPSPGLQEKKDIINSLIRNSLIGMEAEREKLDQNPEFQSRLKMLKNDLLMREYISQKIEPLVTVKDEEIEEILRQNPNLIPKETVTVKEILVNTEKEAEGIYQELKKGADFSKIAVEKSISPSKTKGGLIGEVSRGQLPPPLGTVLFSLNEGEFSQPTKTDEGFRIFYIVSKKKLDPDRAKMLEGKLREKILDLQKRNKIEAILQKKVEELKKEIKVETYFDQLK
jgi:peptidyl-prolyl cis-trans isomerase C